MNSDPRKITLSDAHLNAAVEEYLHRLNLIGKDEIITIGPGQSLFFVGKPNNEEVKFIEHQ